jgi:AcrR family transcriptional regulator
MRADAERNRARVLEAAETVLTRDGLDAPMRSIASQAGVGVATVYRQYPTKKIFADALESAGLDPKAAAPDSGHDGLHAIEALLVRAQQADAVRSDVRHARAARAAVRGLSGRQAAALGRAAAEPDARHHLRRPAWLTREYSLRSCQWT